MLICFIASADTISSLFNNNNLMGYAAAARKYSDYAVSGIGAAAAHHAHYAAAAHHASPYTQSHHYDPLTAATNFSPVSSATSSVSTINSVGGGGMMSHTNASGDYFKFSFIIGIKTISLFDLNYIFMAYQYFSK